MSFWRAGTSRALLAVAIVAFSATSGTAAGGTTLDTTAGAAPSLQDSWDASEPGLTSLTAPDVRQLWSSSLGSSAAAPNQIYARPVAADGRIIVATEDNQVAALNPTTGAIEWQTGVTPATATLGPGWTPTPTCGDLTPHVGITSTPVYDPSTKTIYVIAKQDDGPDLEHPSMRVHALSATTGREQPGWPLTIAGKSMNGGRTFNAATSNQRPGLLLAGGALYFGTASHCDNGPFVGFVGRVALPAAPARPSVTLWTTEPDDANGQAGIWQSGGGIVSDGVDAQGNLRLFVASGNGLGVSPAPGVGTSPPRALAESVVRLNVAPDGSMRAADFFSPTNNHRLDEDDADLGSGAPVGLPDSFGSGAHPHLLVIAGKDGVVRLLDRDALGGVAQGPGGTDDVVSSLDGKGVWGHAAAFDGGTGHRYLYLAPSGSPMQAITVSPDAAGDPALSAVAATTDSFPFSTGSPLVTSDGSDASTALVWIVTSDGPSGTNGRLLAYPATPPAGGDWKPVLSFPLGTVAKFVQPTSVGGRIFVGTRDGRVLSFGARGTSPVTIAPTDFGLVPVGQSSTQTVTATARSDVTITGVSASAGFTVDPAAVAVLPVTVAAGGSVNAAVTFHSSTVGVLPGTLTLDTSAGQFRFSLRGTGAADGIAASPATLAFGPVAVGQGAVRGVTIQNTGTSSTTVTAPPTLDQAGSNGSNTTGPFSLSGAAVPIGLVTPKQSSVTLVVRVLPTSSGPLTGTLRLATSTGSLSVALTATAFTGQPQLALTVSSLNFGSIEPGELGGQAFQVLNVGTATMVITKAAVPGQPFTVPNPLSEGLTIEPGDSAYVQVFARPISAMPHTDFYSVSVGPNSNGTPPPSGNSPQRVTFTLNSAPWSGSIVGHAGCVTVHGTPRAGAPTVDTPCVSGPQTAFIHYSSGHYHLSANHALCLATVKGGTARGTPVGLATCTTATDSGQTWIAGTNGTLADRRSKLCLRPKSGSKTPGTALVLDSCSSAATTEQWDVTGLLAHRGLVSSGLGSLGRYCLTDHANSTSSSSPMQLSACSFASGQMITAQGQTLRVQHSCMATAATAHGSAVQIKQCSGAASQVWTADSHGRLYNPASKQCLTVPGASTLSGTALHIATCTTTAAQRWSLPA